MNNNFVLLLSTLLNLAILALLFYRQRKQKDGNSSFQAVLDPLQRGIEQLKENQFSNAAQLQQAFSDRLNQFSLQHSEALAHFQGQLQQAFADQRSNFDKHQFESLKALH